MCITILQNYSLKSINELCVAMMLASVQAYAYMSLIWLHHPDVLRLGFPHNIEELFAFLKSESNGMHSPCTSHKNEA